MFRAIEKYKDSQGSEYWLIIDSKHGTYYTGWLTTRPEPYIIIHQYLNWDMDPLVNLCAYYMDKSSFNVAMQKLNKDNNELIGTRLPYSDIKFSKYYKCIKNYLEKSAYIGYLK